MFTLIDKHLKSLGRRGPLPAGIIITGGGAGIGVISDIAKGALKLPARIAEFRLSADTKIRDATWAVAYGIALWGLTGDTSAPTQEPRHLNFEIFPTVLALSEKSFAEICKCYASRVFCFH